MASLTATTEQAEVAPRLKLAFCLYKYFPYGGLQRDFLRIALECQRLGHSIRVYTLSWRGEIPAGFEVIIVPAQAFTNHTRYERFYEWVQAALARNPVDGVVGINKMPGLDVYYAADSCYKEKAYTQRTWPYRLLPRYRHFARFEEAVFAPESQTEILMISETQRPFFEKYYHTPAQRMHFLPPGISRDRIAPDNAEEIRADMRRELGVADDEHLLLMVGSGFIKKGLKRAIYAVRSLPSAVREKTRFFVIGEDNPTPFRRLALMLGIRRQVTILSGRDDVPRFLLAADLLLHPALDENAGIVLLEAIVAGLPVLATDVCGYGHYVEEAEVGQLVRSPFRQSDLNRQLLGMIRDNPRSRYQENGKVFARTADIYTLPVKAAQIVQQVTRENVSLKSVGNKLAFCLFKYFPYGGLQRDFLRIALECQQRGFRIRVYTLSWQGEIPRGFDVVIVPVNALTNHTRYERYSEWVADHIAENPVTGTVGFNKMPGLDVYYAADACYEEKARTQRSSFYRMIPRYQLFSRFERAVFDREAETEILMISEVQKPLFEKYYGTSDDRCHLLPPGISRDRIAPDNAELIRADMRREFGIADDEHLLLMVGSGFITKGLDRVLNGLAALPITWRNKTRLFVIGQDAPGAFLRLAQRLGIGSQVEILRGRDDIPRFLLGADTLVHPAYVENTGTVLLEAMVAGLPVLATDICGYAHYITDANAGMVVPSPFDQSGFNAMLLETMTSPERGAWQENGLRFAADADIYEMPSRAADLIAGKFLAVRH